MFSFRSQSSTHPKSSNSRSKSGLKWFGKKTILDFTHLVDNTLSNISDQILRQANEIQYQSELSRVQRETLENESSIGFKPNSETPSKTDPEIDQLKKTLSSHYRYKQNLEKPLIPSSKSNLNQFDKQKKIKED